MKRKYIQNKPPAVVRGAVIFSILLLRRLPFHLRHDRSCREKHYCEERLYAKIAQIFAERIALVRKTE